MEPEPFAGAVIELVGHAIESGFADDAEVRALGEVLAQVSGIDEATARRLVETVDNCSLLDVVRDGTYTRAAPEGDRAGRR